ncbi:hypothetical protein EHS39_34120, partial [Ensifer sp. MPMI2T]
FRLAQDRKDLGFAKSARLHQNLLDHIAEKILLLNPVNAREDYQCMTSFFAARRVPKWGGPLGEALRHLEGLERPASRAAAGEQWRSLSISGCPKANG